MKLNFGRYGIFRKLPDGAEILVRMESDLPKAMETIAALARSDGMDYFVRDFQRGISIPRGRPENEPPEAK